MKADSDNNNDNTVKIAILYYPRAMTSAVFGIQEMLEVANRYLRNGDRGRFHSYVVAASGAEGPASALAVPMVVEAEVADVVIVPPALMDSAHIEADPQTRAWLSVQAEHGAVVCSVCAGAFLLAEAGLLEGYAATTHWALATAFRHRYPNTRLRVEEMIVDEGDRITAGGVTAYLDLTLHLIRRFAGERVAVRVGSHLLIDHTGRRQSLYQRFLPDTDHGDAVLMRAQQVLDRDFRKTLRIGKLASEAGVSERTLLRRFRSVLGLTPVQYLQALRLERARELLESSHDPVDRVTRRVGYEDVSSFRRLFKQSTGLSPTEYRQKFSSGADVHG